MLGREDDVRVVRQHDHLLRVERLHRAEQVGGRRVHRLAALDDSDRPDALCELQEEVSVTIADRVDLLGREQALESVFAHGFEQPVVHLRRVLLNHHQRLVDERREDVYDAVALVGLERAHGLAGLQSEAAREDGQAAKEHAVLVREEVVTPVHGGAQRSMAR